MSKAAIAKELFALTELAQVRGWSAEELLCGEIRKREREMRRRESKRPPALP